MHEFTCERGHRWEAELTTAVDHRNESTLEIQSNVCPHCGAIARAVAVDATISWHPYQNENVAEETRSTDRPRLLPRRRIGRFEIISELGSGGFGVVYRARDPQLDREVAIKIPKDDVLRSADDRERFFREARAAATLHHANICPVHEVGEIDGQLFLIMAYVPGRTLARIIERGKEISNAQAASAIRKLALALDVAHSKGIVHRDLKPANIMINERGEPVIMDFGLAQRRLPNDVPLTMTGIMMGTPAYMPPEQARGDSKLVGPSADIYSLGIILYELLAGERPFKGTFADVLAQVLHAKPQLPSKIRPDVDPELEAICLRAIEKNPQQRFASMREFANALSDYLLSSSNPLRFAIRNSLQTELGDFPEKSQGESSTIKSVESVPGINTQAVEPISAPVARFFSRRWLAIGGGILTALVLFGTIAKIMLRESRLGTNSRPRSSQQPNHVVSNQNSTASTSLESLASLQTEIRRFQHPKPVMSVVALPGRRQAISASEDGLIRLWDLDSGNELGKFVGHTHVVKSIAYSPTQSMLLSGSSDKSMRLWRQSTRAEIHLFAASTWEVHCVRFSPDGTRALSAGLEGTVRLWDVRNGNELKKYVGHSGSVFCVDFSPTADRIVSGGTDNIVRIWDTETADELLRLEGHTNSIWSVSFSGDGERILTSSGFTNWGKALAGGDYSARLWNARTGAEIRRFSKHSGSVRRAVFSPNGKWVLTAAGGDILRGRIEHDRDPTIRVWDVASGELLYTFNGHRSVVFDVAFLSDEQFISASFDKTMRLWQMPDQRQLELRVGEN